MQDDVIYRQEAIDKFEPWLKANGYNEGELNMLKAVLYELKCLPAAEPELDEWCTDCKEYDHERHCCPRWNRVIRETLKDAELERKKERWIPCSERLPKKYGWYQVTLKDGRVSRLYYDYKSGRWIDNVRKHMFEMYDIYSKLTHKRITEENEDVYWDNWVIAWMPLPEPYRGGEEDGNQTE